MTTDDAGNSVDPYFTALRLQEEAKDDNRWSSDYIAYYRNNYEKEPAKMGFPKLEIEMDDEGDFVTSFDRSAAEKWLAEHQELWSEWHKNSAEHANRSEERRVGKE